MLDTYTLQLPHNQNNTLMETIHIALAENHHLIRSALVRHLNQEDGFEVVLSASNGQELINRLNDNALPDVVLIDINMPIMDGPTAIRALRAKYGHRFKILGLSVHTETVLVKSMLDAGADGYISKACQPKVLHNAIVHCLKNEIQLSSDISICLQQADKPSYLDLVLNQKEEAILKLICEEKTNKEISEALNISINTVNTYRTRMIEKLGVKNTVGLVIYAYKTGLYRHD